MKRMLALLLCLVFCLSLLPAAFAVEIVEPAAEEPEEEIRLVEIAEEPVFEEKPNADGSIVYRALLIGEVRFDRETANRNRGDVERISEMLGNVVGPAGSAYDVTSKYDLSYSGIESAISSAFSGADSNDVSLFFMATHGVTNLSSGTYAGALETIEEPGVTTDLLPLEDLAAWLNAVPGKIIVVLGSCGSGAAIYADGKTTVVPNAGDEADAAFTGAVIRTFAQADEDMRAPGAAEPQTGEFRSSKYYVLTAAAHQESSWGQESEDSEYCYNAFPFFFAQGGYYKPNYYYSESGHTQGDMMADSDGNNVVTLNEMYQYIYDKAYGPYSSDGQDYYQHAQVYPSDSSYPLFGNSGNSCASGHDWGEWETLMEPTCTEDGVKSRTCARCGECEMQAIKAPGHDYHEAVTEPTCTEQGYTTYTCSRCGDYYMDNYVEALGHDYHETVTEPTCTEQGCTTYTCSRCGDSYIDGCVDALGHDWGEWETLMEPTCTEDGVKSRTCARCGEREMQAIAAPGHDYHETVTEPTCTEQGYTTYTCSRCGDSYRDNYVEALGHDWGEWETLLEPICTEDGVKSRTCARCGEREMQAIAAPGHDYQETVTEPTCTEQGYTTYTCRRCGDSYRDNYVEALGHDWGEWETLMEPTCTEDGVKSRTCARCGECEMQAIAAPGHDYQETVTEPTCTEQGYTTYTCRRCGDYYLDNYVEALGHDYYDTVTEPTCTTGGYTTHVCSRCSDSYLDSYTDALGHDYGEPDWAWSDDYFAAAATFSCGRCDESETLDAEISFAPGSSQTLATAKVTFINKDYQDTKTIRLSISETKLTLPVSESNVLELFLDSGAAAKAEWSSSNPTAATVDGDGKVTAHKYGKATVTGTAYGLSFSCEVQTLFWDVTDPSVYYFKHVYWAADMGITKGYDLEYFAPQEECPREQMMTFLWRLAGQPKPKTTSCPFPDVQKGAYYYKAVLWGVEKGITNGYSSGEYAGKFGVGIPCTREQAMTFLWRMAGKPNPKTTTNKFSDVKKTDYFYKAILWASENRIANGYEDGTYGVGLACLREHMVTFLSRYYTKFM